jgi:hypothetical protein
MQLFFEEHFFKVISLKSVLLFDGKMMSRRYWLMQESGFPPRDLLDIVYLPQSFFQK